MDELQDPSALDWLAEASALRTVGTPFALVTVIECKGSTPRPPGAKMLVTAAGRAQGTIGGGRLEELVVEDARKALAAAMSRPRSYPLCMRAGQCCGGAVDVFIEIIGLGPLLYLFGAGHVGQALARTLRGTPFTVHVVDQRREWLDHPDLPPGVVRHAEPWPEFARAAVWDAERVYVAVMTHDHQLDLEIMRDLTGGARPARFVGLIGSTTKWDRFRQRLGAQGVGPEALARVVCPIGLAIGGKAPQEVAVSVAAQLLQAHHLRD